MVLTRTHLTGAVALLGVLFFVIHPAAAWQGNGYNPYYQPPGYYYPPRHGYPVAAAYPYQPPGWYPGLPAPSRYLGQSGPPEPLPRKQITPDRDKVADGEQIYSLKQRFVEKLLPAIQQENSRLATIRTRLTKLVQILNAGYDIKPESRQWLQSLAKRYRLDSNPLQQRKARNELLNRVDTIPASLTLAQAANESGWGRSRFATEGNNLFGIWTFDTTKGLKPQRRDSDKQHLVRRFEHFGDSVRYYMHMLNSHPAYTDLRAIRALARQEQRTPQGMEMAAGLEKYSARGEEYIALIRQLIHQNQWTKLDRTSAG